MNNRLCLINIASPFWHDIAMYSLTKNIFMKTIKSKVVMFVTAILLSAFAINTASAQPPHAKAYGKHKYYYYPASNVYYDAGPRLYYYNAGSSWTGVSVLPPGITFSSGAPKYAVYHDGPEVWRDNEVHRVKYKAYKNKPVKYIKHEKHEKHQKHDKKH